MPADLLRAARVLGAVENEDLAVFHHRGRIERGVRLPRHDAVVHRRAKAGGGIRRDDRVYLHRFGERTKHPRLLAGRGGAAEQGEQRAATDDGSQGVGTERDRRREISPVSGTAMSISSHAPIGTATNTAAAFDAGGFRTSRA